jgi:hypothetical protein
VADIRVGVLFIVKFISEMDGDGRKGERIDARVVIVQVNAETLQIDMRLFLSLTFFHESAHISL